MSDLQDVIASTSVKAFNSGYLQGARDERQRIIKLLENRQLIFRDPVAYDAFTALITGEENND